jgi:hypothetical protein
LISIDGMHAIDYLNCAAGIGGTPGTPTCPNLAALGATGVNYLQASTSKPSDSFPGLAALVTGASPRNSGFFYDVSYDRSLSPPATTTPYGIVGGANLCPGTVGTQVGFDEEIDIDLTQINGGGGINPAYLPRDPKNGCAPVYPHEFLRSNTFFEVVKANTQVAQTIVAALGYSPSLLQSTLKELTEVLPGLTLDNPPVVSIKSVSDTSAKEVTLDASASTDPNGSALSFLWTNPTNNAAIIGATTATPSVQLLSFGRYEFMVKVTNAAGVSSYGTVSFNYLGY